MSETVTVAGTTVTHEILELMFAELREHHWFGIPPQYRPSIGRLQPLRGCVGTLENVLYERMADGTMPGWFKRQFMSGGAIVGTRDGTREG